MNLTIVILNAVRWREESLPCLLHRQQRMTRDTLTTVILSGVDRSRSVRATESKDPEDACSTDVVERRFDDKADVARGALAREV